LPSLRRFEMGKRDRDVLASVPLFSPLSSRQLRRLADLCEEQRYMEGAAVVRIHEPGDSFFVIVEGQAKVVSGSGRLLARLYPGDFFGEISLLDGGPRTASVLAETPLLLSVLSRKSFQKLLMSEAAVSVKLLQHSAGMLRRLESPVAG
jgi:CRP/FNR family cyclic AMP-dependent transcriptional regulator